VGKQAFVLVVAALAAALVVSMVGCGSDSSTASVTKAEFIKKAEAACEKGEERIQKDFAAFVKKHENVKNPTKADYAELVDEVMTHNIDEEIDQIQAIGAPSGEEDRVNAIITAREESVKTAEGQPELVIKESKKVFGKASSLAKAYGLQACANR
jgi:hypothetical protein